MVGSSASDDPVSDPLKEQFHLPSAFVNESYSERRKGKVISQKCQPFLRLGIDIADAPQRIRIRLDGPGRDENYGLVGSYAGGLIDRVGVAPLEEHILLRARDKKRR